MVPIGPDQKQGENRDDDGKRQPARRHRGVKKDNVENDRAKNDQPQHRKEIKEQEQAANDLAEENYAHVAGGRNGGEELACGTVSRWRRHMDEMEESVKTKDDKNEAKQAAYENRDNFHAAKIALFRRRRQNKRESDAAAPRAVG